MTARPVAVGALLVGLFGFGYSLGYLSAAPSVRADRETPVSPVPPACLERVAALELRAYNLGRSLESIERAVPSFQFLPAAPPAKLVVEAEAQGASAAPSRASKAPRAQAAGGVR